MRIWAHYFSFSLDNPLYLWYNDPASERYAHAFKPETGANPVRDRHREHVSYTMFSPTGDRTSGKVIGTTEKATGRTTGSSVLIRESGDMQAGIPASFAEDCRVIRQRAFFGNPLSPHAANKICKEILP